MRKNYFKECWSCGSRNLEPYLTGVKCQDCGATHNELPQPGGSTITTVDDETGKAPRPRHSAHSRPSGIVSRRAAAARSKKVG